MVRALNSVCDAQARAAIRFALVYISRRTSLSPLTLFFHYTLYSRWSSKLSLDGRIHCRLQQLLPSSSQYAHTFLHSSTNNSLESCRCLEDRAARNNVSRSSLPRRRCTVRDTPRYVNHRKLEFRSLTPTSSRTPYTVL